MIRSTHKILEKKLHIWFGQYLKGQLKKIRLQRKGNLPRQIIFLFVDHFEPRVGGVCAQKEQERLNKWVELYPQLVRGHSDSNGRPPQHSWFYPYDQMNIKHLKQLSALCYQGLGEIELHLHHGYDTSESLRQKLLQALESYSQTGAQITAEALPQKTYGFIHGNFALDNSRGDDRFCGVNDELKVLKDTGCYADFTFPAYGLRAQPAKINSLYYAKDTPGPKSYNRGVDVQVGKSADGDLMIVEGPLTVNWRAGFCPKIEDGNIAGYHLPTERRVGLWIDSNVHVLGREEWIFVKIFTHGAEEGTLSTVLGEEADRMFSYLEQRYNDGKNYQLHYVTAREAYNIIKAAEAGEKGNPYDYRNYVVKPYANTKINCNRLYRLLSYLNEEIRLEILEEGFLEIQFKGCEDFRLTKLGDKVPYKLICRKLKEEVMR